MKRKYERITRIASYIFCNTCLNSDSGNYCISFEEIEEEFDLKLDKGLAKKIADRLCHDFRGVLDVEIYDDEFNVIVGTSFVRNFEEHFTDECYQEEMEWNNDVFRVKERE